MSVRLLSSVVRFNTLHSGSAHHQQRQETSWAHRGRCLKPFNRIGVSPLRWYSQKARDAHSKYVVVEVDGEKRRAINLTAPNFQSAFTKRFQKKEDRGKEDGSILTKFPQLRYFFPNNYPSSVAPEYGRYVTWLFLSSLVGSTTYVLTMTSLLHSVNVSSNAAGLAAGVSWVLKDGFGSLGMIMSSYLMGDRFDEDTKRSRWRADVLANIGSGLELLTVAFPHLFLVLGTIANVFKGVSGLAWGACNASIHRHLMRQRNMGDISAKIATQRMLAYLVGSSTGIALTQQLEVTSLMNVNGVNNTIGLPLSYTACAYVILVCCHLFSSYRHRLALLADLYFQGIPLLSPEAMRDGEVEYIVTKYPPDRKMPIELGSHVAAAFIDPADLSTGIEDIHKRGYTVKLSNNRDCVHIVIGSEASNSTIYRSYFHALCYRHAIFSARGESFEAGLPELHCNQESDATKISSKFVDSHMSQFTEALESQGWDVSQVLLRPGSTRVSVKEKAMSEEQ